MKKGVFLMVCCLLLVLMAAAEENVLYPILENDLWGYMNRQGETVIEAVYDRADDFCEDGLWRSVKRRARKSATESLTRRGMKWSL